MDTAVIIKGYKNGIILYLSPELSFEELTKRLKVKCKESAKFLGTARMALTFDGRVLSNEEQREVLRIFSEFTDLEIVCVFDQDTEKEDLMETGIDSTIGCLSNATAQVHTGSLTGRMSLTVENSIIITGNVESGCKVTAGGSVFILGAMRGIITAGANNSVDACVYAAEFDPQYLCIGDVEYDPYEKTEKERKKLFKTEKRLGLLNRPQVARIRGRRIVVERVETDEDRLD